MKPELHLRIAGALQIILALLHFYFPFRFRWQEDTAKLSPLNRQIFWVHTFFIMLIMILFGLLSCFATDELIASGRLPRLILGGISFFWLVRLVFQFFVYDSAHWRGSRLHTVAHWGFALLWAYLVFAYSCPLWSR
jgi:hypothetical protein